jgi:hypothetical protein
MKLKLTAQEFFALYALLQQLNHKYVCEEMEDKLYHVLLTGAFIKLHKISIIKKEKYSVKFSEAEAIAFWICTCDHKLPESSFEGNLLNGINNSIHQKFAV